jgi:hypothetical protein
VAPRERPKRACAQKVSYALDSDDDVDLTSD